MTDSPTSGTPRPFEARAQGAPANGGPASDRPVVLGTSDASATLVELERKLDELERDLAAIGSAARGPADAGVTGMGGERAPSSVPRPTARLVDEASPVGGPDPLEPATPILSRDADPALFPGAPAPEPTITHAVPASHKPRHDPGEGVREFGAADWLDLLRFRDQLERGAPRLVDEYDRLLAHLPTPAQAPAAPPASTPLPAAEPSPAPSGPSSAAGAAEPSFECRVELDAGPFANVAALSSFERALAGLPHALDARVRRFDGARAAIDLRLALTPALVQEMREGLALGFRVVDSGPSHLAVVLDQPKP